jgi:hypothetical protein
MSLVFEGRIETFEMLHSEKIFPYDLTSLALKRCLRWRGGKFERFSFFHAFE